MGSYVKFCSYFMHFIKCRDALYFWTQFIVLPSPNCKYIVAQHMRFLTWDPWALEEGSRNLLKLWANCWIPMGKGSVFSLDSQMGSRIQKDREPTPHNVCETSMFPKCYQTLSESSQKKWLAAWQVRAGRTPQRQPHPTGREKEPWGGERKRVKIQGQVHRCPDRLECRACSIWSCYFYCYKIPQKRGTMCLDGCLAYLDLCQ